MCMNEKDTGISVKVKEFQWVPEVICDRRTSAKVKEKVAELMKLRFSRMDRTRNNYFRGTAQVELFGDKVREAMLRWFEHMQKRDGGYI